MFIKPTKEAAGSVFNIHEDMMDALLYPASEDVPCPWDADVAVDGNKVIIEGTLGPIGPRGAYCRCECSVEDFSKYYKLEVPDTDDNSELVSAIAAAGWIEA